MGIKVRNAFIYISQLLGSAEQQLLFLFRFLKNNLQISIFICWHRQKFNPPQNQSAKEFNLAYYRALENVEISKESIKCGFLTVFGSVLQASY